MLQHSTLSIREESGFVLVFSMVALLMLSLFGMWALQTSKSELDVAGGLQQMDRQMNVAEGAAYLETTRVGLFQRTFYNISNPEFQTFKPLVPTSNADFDPGNDTNNNPAGIVTNDHSTWPWDNLLQNYTNIPSNTNDYDYRYLVTYLGTAGSGGTTKKGPGQGNASEETHLVYYRIDGNAARSNTVVEVGGKKIIIKQ